MPDTKQSYANHTRWHAPFHFVAMPILAMHFFYTAYRLYQQPAWPQLEALLVAFALLITLLLTRLNALKAQDRIIRLEEHLRFQRLLPAELAAQASGLPVHFLVALRFASDEELPQLAQQVIERKLTSPKEIKQAIKHWRSDHFRV